MEVEAAVGETLSVFTLPVEPTDVAWEDCWLEERGTTMLLSLLLLLLLMVLVLDSTVDDDEDAVGLTVSVPE